jgi:hypothetical protein
MCWEDKELNTKGEGVPAVKYWKWIFNSDPRVNVEKAIQSLNAVPLTNTVNNTRHIAAVKHVIDTIQCAHPPDVVAFDATMIIIVASSVGSAVLIIGYLVGHVMAVRNAMLANPLKGVDVQRHLNEVLEDIRDMTDGKVATYIPELGKVSPDLFAIAVVTLDGKIFKASANYTKQSCFLFI